MRTCLQIDMVQLAVLGHEFLHRREIALIVKVTNEHLQGQRTCCRPRCEGTSAAPSLQHDDRHTDDVQLRMNSR
jgi:hypothetical protein